MGTLWLGRAGAGKTHACLARLAEALERGADALLLVPTYGQAEHLRLRLLERVAGLRGRPIETFSSLAERVTGLRLGDLVTPAVRDRVAAEVLPSFFPEAADQPGFRLEFLAAVKEIREQGTDLAELVGKARAHFGEESRGRRLFEAAAAFVDALPGPDHEGLLLRARDRLAARPEPRGLLLVDGFHDFTVVERQIVELLAARAEEAVVTLPGDADDPACPIFLTATRTAEGFPDFRRRWMKGNHRAQGTLAGLEERLFGTTRAPRLTPDRVEVVACASESDEADRLARHVLRSNRPWRDFLLLRRSFDGLHATYRAAFARHGVPLRFFGTEPVAGWPAARAALLWLRHLAGRLEPREALPLLRSPWLLGRPDPAEVDAFADHVRRHGEPDDLAAFPGIAEVLAPRTGRLRDSVRALGVLPALKERPDGDPETARAARVFDHLRREAEAVDDLPLAEAADAVARRLPLLRLAPPDRRHDCVYAVEARDARQWEKPVVLVAGLGADAWPQPVRQDLFLRDDEREDLGRLRDVHLPLRARKEEEERYLFYVALTRARERMVLSWPAFDEEGTALPPSPYLEEALAHLPGLEIRRIPLAEQYVQPRDAVDRRDLLPIVADGLARAHRGTEGDLAVALHDRGVVDRVRLAFPRRLELLRQQAIPGVPAAAARRLSASSLNRFLRCPYLFLLDRVLRVERPREKELDPLLRGTIVHAALEACFERRDEDAGTIFDGIFDRETAALRHGLDERAHRAWMRAVTVRAAADLRGAPVTDVELEFEVPVGDAVLRGKIDRLERHEAGELVRDYKTGQPKLSDLEAFENVQLDAYLLARPEAVGALFERLKKGDAVGFVLDELKDVAQGRSIRTLTRAQLEERRERMRGIVADVVARARAGRLALAPRDPEHCTRTECDGFDLCRVSRARWLAKAGRRPEQ